MKTMLENKHIEVGSNNYRLTINKEVSRGGRFCFYKAYLSDVNSQFTASMIFKNIRELEAELKAWIVEADMLNNPETRVFEQIRRWDGVIQ